jgi:hypothetical protein
VAQAGLSKKRDSISKITRAKRAGDVAQVVEHLPNKCKASSSNANNKDKKKKRERERIGLV